MKDETGIVITCILIGFFMAVNIYNIAKKMILYFKLRANGERAEGTVKKIDGKPLTLLSRGGSAPIFEFQTLSNDVIEGVALNSVYSTPSFYGVGDRCTLFYDSLNPRNFIVKSWTELCMLSFILITFFGFFAMCIWGIIKQIS